MGWREGGVYNSGYGDREGGGRPRGHVLLSAASMLDKASSYQHYQRNIKGIVGKYMDNYKQNVNIITIIVNAARLS